MAIRGCATLSGVVAGCLARMCESRRRAMRARSNGRMAMALALLPMLGGARLAAQGHEPEHRICLAPTTVESAVGSAESLSDAVKATLVGLLTGPSISVAPLSARLESQAREEAKLAGCRHVLFTEARQQRKQGGSLLGQVAGGAVYQGAWQAAGGAGSGVGRIAATAAAGAASASASQLASSTHAKDELSLAYRLETGDGQVLVKKSVKRKASSDGEDLLTPLARNAAEAVAAEVSRSTVRP